jgi:hypothetical protein
MSMGKPDGYNLFLGSPVLMILATKASSESSLAVETSGKRSMCTNV